MNFPVRLGPTNGECLLAYLLSNTKTCHYGHLHLTTHTFSQNMIKGITKKFKHRLQDKVGGGRWKGKLKTRP